MKRIGIIGYGKMGKDIFNQCVRQPDISDITVHCIEECAACEEKMRKELAKSLKRKRITQEQFDAKSENIVFTEKLEDLKDCDIIIECVFENLALKQEIFGKICSIVSKECILATNTSSLAIADIFKDCPNPERCMGIHFFYPVQLTAFAEMNILPETGEEQISKASDFLNSINKKVLVLSGCYHIYLNQIINASISYGLMLMNEKNTGVMQCREIFSEVFPMHGLFGMIDGIGLNLLANNEMKNCCERFGELFDYGIKQMKKWQSEGCSGEPNRFFDTLEESKEIRELSDDEKSEILLDITAFAINEAVTAAGEYGGNAEAMLEAVRDTLGLAESLGYYYDKYGFEKISSSLGRMHGRTGFACCISAEKSAYDAFFK